jgi:hypothetical protein
MGVRREVSDVQKGKRWSQAARPQGVEMLGLGETLGNSWTATLPYAHGRAKSVRTYLVPCERVSLAWPKGPAKNGHSGSEGIVIIYQLRIHNLNFIPNLSNFGPLVSIRIQIPFILLRFPTPYLLRLFLDGASLNFPTTLRATLR